MHALKALTLAPTVALTPNYYPKCPFYHLSCAKHLPDHFKPFFTHPLKAPTLAPTLALTPTCPNQECVHACVRAPIWAVHARSLQCVELYPRMRSASGA